MLTFEPSTSFLVPLDRCINLARARAYASGGDVYFRRQALTFLQVCLSSVINFKGSFVDLSSGGLPNTSVQAKPTDTAAKLKAALLKPQMTMKQPSVSLTRESYLSHHSKDDIS